MRLIRALAAAAACIGAALGFAGPAQAEQQVLEGVYTYTQQDGLTGTWTIYPSCVPTVGDLREPLYLPVACRLHVQAFPGVAGGDAVLTNGVWAYHTRNREGMKCPDGSWAPINETYEFDTNTMSGTRSTFHSADCGLPPGMVKTPFTLAFKEPLPIPVDRYPLNCEPAGLRICS
ncbi:hypothetical protein [Mycobacterium hubeiense]|uniref:hypothetical protein n=1 Tax=Mycobacterium hubeiense TaxID=1867256 RepID=UPI000C7F0CF2|nr:hypothetical protein [Mycobacterium sp. QGD 101]